MITRLIELRVETISSSSVCRTVFNRFVDMLSYGDVKECQTQVQSEALWDAHCKTKKHLEVRVLVTNLFYIRFKKLLTGSGPELGGAETSQGS